MNVAPLSQVEFQKQLYGYMIGEDSITRYTEKRIYNTRLPQHSVFPAVTFQVVDIKATDTKDGPSCYDVVRLQINCYAARLTDCERLYDAVRNKFDRFNNEVGKIKFHQTFFLDREPSQFDEDQKVNWISLDFNFHIK